MNKIYSYSELKGVIRVGQKVKAVKDKSNACSELLDGKTGIITKVDDDSIWINGCNHSFRPDNYLEIISEEKTWENMSHRELLNDLIKRGIIKEWESIDLNSHAVICFNKKITLTQDFLISYYAEKEGVDKDSIIIK